MTAFPLGVNKLSAFRHRNLVKYLQSIQRAGSSANVYSYGKQNIQDLGNHVTQLVNSEGGDVKKGIFGAYESLFREIAMCDNYVKLMLKNFQNTSSNDELTMLEEMKEDEINAQFISYQEYRESIYDSASVFALYLDQETIDEEAKKEFTRIYNEVYNLSEKFHRENFKKMKIQQLIAKTYTPYDIGVDDVVFAYFDNSADYKYVLERCQSNRSCEKLLSTDISYVKDLYYTFFTVGIRILNDSLEGADVQSLNLLTKKLSDLLFLDIKLRDCQSERFAIEGQQKFSGSFDGHLEWRKSIWDTAITLYDIKASEKSVKREHILTIFSSVLSNIKNSHRDELVYKALVKLDINQFLSKLSRFIPN